jgi:SAM-dependent methyltransferase
MENDAAGFAMEEMRPRFLRMAGRHENGTAPRAVVVYQLFQTPPDVAACLIALLGLRPGARILEPSAGLGRLLDALQPYEPAEIVAVEQATDCAAELFRQNRERVTIKQRDFLTLTPAELGTFDAVVMNPPFHMRADIRHIEHALKFVKPGGTLAAICLDGHRRRATFAPRASKWVDLPAGTFKTEGTNVAACAFTIEAAT